MQSEPLYRCHHHYSLNAANQSPFRQVWQLSGHLGEADLFLMIVGVVKWDRKQYINMITTEIRYKFKKQFYLICKTELP